MNTTDKIIAALSPGSIFNRNGLVFRSVSSLAEFSGISEEEVLELLNGDMSQIVTCKPSKKGKGILVALTEMAEAQKQAEQEALADGPVQIVAGPVNPIPAPGDQPDPEADIPFDEAPDEDADHP